MYTVKDDLLESIVALKVPKMFFENSAKVGAVNHSDVIKVWRFQKRLFGGP
jgi:hypothetical protein